MTKVKTAYFCQQCGAEFSQWQGQCNQCQSWNSMATEVVTATANHHVGHYAGSESKVIFLKDVCLYERQRIATGLAEFDLVLGGGLVSDSVVLIGGDPGIGKSTLLLQIICQLSRHYRSLYVTGEESLQQIALRAERLGLSQESL